MSQQLTGKVADLVQNVEDDLLPQPSPSSQTGPESASDVVETSDVAVIPAQTEMPLVMDACQAESPEPETRLERLPIQTLQPHPFAARVPRMSTKDRERFHADVHAKGVMEPILVQEPDVVLDGLHRLDEAKARGDTDILARIVNLRPAEQVERVYQASLRRNLTDDQRALLGFMWMEEAGRQAREDRARTAGQAGGRGRPKASDCLLTNAAYKLRELLRCKAK